MENNNNSFSLKNILTKMNSKNSWCYLDDNTESISIEKNEHDNDINNDDELDEILDKYYSHVDDLLRTHAISERNYEKHMLLKYQKKNMFNYYKFISENIFNEDFIIPDVPREFIEYYYSSALYFEPDNNYVYDVNVIIDDDNDDDNDLSSIFITYGIDIDVI